MVEKPRNKAALRYNSLNRQLDKRNNLRYARISQEHKHLELRLYSLEMEVAREQTSVYLSKKNEKQVLGWII